MNIDIPTFKYTERDRVKENLYEVEGSLNRILRRMAEAGPARTVRWGAYQDQSDGLRQFVVVAGAH
jgi:hypothetical protein